MNITGDLAGLDVDELAPQTFSVEDENPFSTMMAGFDEAADRIGLDPDVYTMLRNPDREIRVSLPTQLDDGRLAVFDGWRCSTTRASGRTSARCASSVRCASRSCAPSPAG